MAQKCQAVLKRTDLPKTNRQSIQDAIELLFQRHVKGSDALKKNKKEVDRWAEFAQELKRSLDRYCEAGWHVIVGKEVGFACKKRDKTMGIWNIDNCTVLIYRSPGIELIPPPETPETVAGDEKVEESTVPTQAVRVLAPESVEEGSDIERVVSALKEEALVTSAKEVEVFVQALRKRLTKELGTIWHVVGGSEFIVEMAEDFRNHVLATVGKTRIVCYQHEQFSGSKVDWVRILKALPYLIALAFMFSYMGLNMICAKDYTPTTRIGTRMQERFCSDDWESNIAMVGAASIGTLMVCKTMNKVSTARSAKQKLA